MRANDFEWGHHKPGEVVSAGRAGITSPSSRPTSPSGSARTGLDVRGPATAAREVKAAPTAGSGARVGRVSVPAASTLPTHRLVNERLRGAW